MKKTAIKAKKRLRLKLRQFIIKKYKLKNGDINKEKAIDIFNNDYKVKLTHGVGLWSDNDVEKIKSIVGYDEYVKPNKPKIKTTKEKTSKRKYAENKSMSVIEIIKADLIKKAINVNDWNVLLAFALTKNYEAFLKSYYWKLIRNKVLQRDNNKCSVCSNTKKLIIHHKTYINHFNEHNHLEDLITLCENCHKKEHNININ